MLIYQKNIGSDTGFKRWSDRRREMKITVITVCLNSVDTIEKAINSVIGQKYDDFETV